MTKVWTKTVLSAYPYLIKIADAIDRIVERRALNSFYVSSVNYSSNNIYDLANNILRLSDRKVSLINLKILVEETLKKCDRGYAKLLIAKYFSRKKSAEICKMFSLPERTYFRKIKEAESQFERKMIFAGYDEKFLVNLLENEGWIFGIKTQFEKTKKEDVLFQNINLKQVAL